MKDTGSIIREKVDSNFVATKQVGILCIIQQTKSLAKQTGNITNSCAISLYDAIRTRNILVAESSHDII